jgi:DNA-binding transcriptional LysR family regulator
MRLVGVSGSLRAVRHAPRLVTDDLHMLHEGALQGLGVVLLPTVAVAGDLEAGRLIDLLPEARRSCFVFPPAERPEIA